MHLRIFAVSTVAMLFLVPGHAQQSHWASADDTTAKYMINMERKWAEGVCADNGVVASLLADDFQGTSTIGTRFTKSDELKGREEDIGDNDRAEYDSTWQPRRSKPHPLPIGPPTSISSSKRRARACG